ncbi:MAG: hypothetical protein ABI321_22465 [Polyangia bacterium]
MRYVVAILVLLVAARANAGAGTVAVLGVSGAEPSFADGVEQDLSDLYEVVPGEVYKSAATRMGRPGASPTEVSAVCQSIRVDALVAGAVNGQGAARRLVVVVRAGTTGQVVSRTRYEVANRSLATLRSKVVRDLMNVLDTLQRVPRRSVTVAPRVATPPPDEASPESADENDEAPTVAHAAPAPVAQGFYMGVGPGLMSRSLRFSGGAAGSRGGAVATMRVDGGIFPLALSRELAEAHPVLAALGLVGSYTHGFDFTSGAAGAERQRGRASRWSALLVARVPLGHESSGGTLSIEAGFQSIMWTSVSPQLLGVPDVGYALIDAGLSWQHTLGSRRVELRLRAAALGLVDGGGITSRNEYGRGTAWGLDAGAGVIVRPTSWLWLSVNARYTPLFLTFHEAGARYARSASDQFVDGNLEVGFAL